RLRAHRQGPSLPDKPGRAAKPAQAGGEVSHTVPILKSIVNRKAPAADKQKGSVRRRGAAAKNGPSECERTSPQPGIAPSAADSLLDTSARFATHNAFAPGAAMAPVRDVLDSGSTPAASEQLGC